MISLCNLYSMLIYKTKLINISIYIKLSVAGSNWWWKLFPLLQDIDRVKVSWGSHLGNSDYCALDASNRVQMHWDGVENIEFRTITSLGVSRMRN